MTNTDYQSDTIKDITPDPLGARRIVVLVSGNGSNLQALIDAQSHDRLGGGEIVAVISNGTAILGLGNLGALASKPVMEGKAVLFKRFADVDSIDIELEEKFFTTLDWSLGGFLIDRYEGAAGPATRSPASITKKTSTPSSSARPSRPISKIR